MLTDRNDIIAFRRSQLAVVAREQEARALRTMQWLHTQNVKVSQFIR